MNNVERINIVNSEPTPYHQSETMYANQENIDTTNVSNNN